MQKDTPNYYAVIPAQVRYDNEISLGARMLYGELMALSGREGYAWAGNGKLAEWYAVHPDTISGWVSELHARGYIRLAIVKGIARKVYPLVGVSAKRPKVSAKTPEGLGEKAEGGIGEKAEHNITSKNNLNEQQTAAPPGAADIQAIIDSFKVVNPSYAKLFRNTTQRGAVQRMLKQWPREKLLQIVELCGKSNGQQYAPVITTPVQLEDKMAALQAWWKRNRGVSNKVTKV